MEDINLIILGPLYFLTGIFFMKTVRKIVKNIIDIKRLKREIRDLKNEKTG